MKQRCRHDIIEALLKNLSAEPLRVTNLCSKSNLPVDRCKNLLEILKEAGLVVERVEGRGRTYIITSRGYEYLALYRRLKEVLAHKL